MRTVFFVRYTEQWLESLGMISRFLQGLIFITIKINFGDLGNEIEIKQKMPTKCNFFYLGNERELPENQGKNKKSD